MKRITEIVIVLGLVGVLTVMIGWSKAKEESATKKVVTKKIDKEREIAAQEIKPGKIEVIDLGKDVKLEMILIPAGKFVMGSPESEKGRSKDKTQHEVTLTKPFYMGKYEVTQEQWKAVMGTVFLWFGGNPSNNKGAKYPVTNVSWNDCQDFIKKLNTKTNGGYRLPTEAEWEYACRAGTMAAYSFGDSITKSDANIAGSSTKAVGSYKPNAFGLYDMHGNVWEWCEDWGAGYPAGAVTDPKGAATGERRVLRGGSFYLFESSARSSFRSYLTPSDQLNGLGFRLTTTK